MGLAQLFIGFLQPIGLGAAAVFVVLLIIRLGMPRRSVVTARRRSFE